jgi:XTP/dITP diphosphohydrolase
MAKLLLGSNNPGKLCEIQALLEGLPIELVTPSSLGLSQNIEEDGKTYAENAARKTRAYVQLSGLVTLADDSGLEVDVLDGAPGIYSARFSQKPGATDADRRVYILQRLYRKPRPWVARFRCTVALATPAGKVYYSEGTCPGEIIDEERGHNGFGYDPIFWLPEYGKTMAELSMAEKNCVSHRARAVKVAIPQIIEILALS